MNIVRTFTLALVALMLASGVASATPSKDLTSVLLARGSWDRHDRVQLARALRKQVHGTSDVAVVEATIKPGGTTGWHRHTGPSVIVVESGELTIMEAGKHRCKIYKQGKGGAFFHTKDTHTFVNNGTVDAHFYVTYFTDVPGPLLIDVPIAPRVC